MCSTRHAGGAPACANHLHVAREVAEELILEPVKEKLLSQEAVRAVMKEIRVIARKAESLVGVVVRGQRAKRETGTSAKSTYIACHDPLSKPSRPHGGASPDTPDPRVTELERLVAAGALSAAEARPAIERLKRAATGHLAGASEPNVFAAAETYRDVVNACASSCPALVP